ncbi:M949_RS01915 family surface polysaccharide biosynthesis protein [Chitinophaga sp. S165]|uniref:M949_RS01915 family surface polysaccharide biosynthesis protein n=1 Tax=Chitinophaga sp. S165 TaxID=2135462 RepID=UPI000D9802B6|nr:hypothetical protein [Chitinophaga sp. S165]PWV47635.1 hypothetical protein C7475_108202 [Chitinophaga sp. S165]
MRMTLATMLIIALSGKQLYAQQVKSNSEILSPAVTATIFSDNIVKQFNLLHPIRRVYSYHDQSGDYYLALCESIDEITKDDTLHQKIKAVNLKKEGNGFVKTWELNDFTNSNNLNNGEESIWFWTKFCEVKDLDRDGITDPLLVYGSSGMNGYDDGRVKIILNYKGQKIAVRHQNSTMDEGRNIQIDAAFYTLPQSIQQHVRALMKTLADKDFTIYPDEYEQAMDKKKLLIN